MNCSKCKIRKAYAKAFDRHFDEKDCPIDSRYCPSKKDAEIKKIKDEAYKEFVEKWNHNLDYARSKLTVELGVMKRAFDLSITLAELTLKELTENNNPKE